MKRRRFIPRRISITLIALGALLLAAWPAGAATTYTVFNTAIHSAAGSEVVTTTPDRQFTLVVGSNDDPGNRKIRAILLSTSTYFREFLDLSLEPALAGLGLVNPVLTSVAMHPSAGYAIVTVAEGDAATIAAGNEKPGGAVFIDIDVSGVMSVSRKAPLPLGIHPSSIAIAPNGQFAVAANSDVGAGVGVAPIRAGTITVIDLRAPEASIAAVATLTPQVPAGPDLFTRRAVDPAPSFVAISPDSARAYVTLRENNALAIVDVRAAGAALQASAATRGLPLQPGTSNRLFANGLAVFAGPGGAHYLLTANQGLGGEWPDSISMFRVDPGPTLALLADSGGAIRAAVSAAGLPKDANQAVQPKMLAAGAVGGVFKAFVTLSQSDAVAVFDVDPASSSRLRLATVVPLNRTGQPAAYGPEGIALAHISPTLDYIVTANSGRGDLVSLNISTIQAVSNGPSPAPNVVPRVWVPLLRR